MRRLTSLFVALLFVPGLLSVWTVGAPARPHGGESAAGPLHGRPATVAAASSSGVRPRWKARLDRMVSGKRVSVSVAVGGRALYGWGAKRQRVPASGQKLLMSMALLDRLGPDATLTTTAAADYPLPTGIVEGDLYVLGRGDPTLASSGYYASGLRVPATRLGDLARSIKRAGITRIKGRVIGSTSYFGRDHWAPGWKSHFPSRYIPIPTALSIDGNRVDGKHISEPELRTAKALSKKLRGIGVKVDRAARAGSPPSGLSAIAEVTSVPVGRLLIHTNRSSSNFFAEMLGKRLGVANSNQGTIAAGAAAIKAFAAGRGVSVDAYDSSGLSYSNRTSARGFTKLLGSVEGQPWVTTLRRSLPKGNQGTLSGRLGRIRLRAKTGTLTEVSTLSGWVWLDRLGTWGSFSVMTRGMSKARAVELENRIVRHVATKAR